MKIIIVGGNAGAKIAAEIFKMNFPHCEIVYAETYLDSEKENQLVDDYKKVPDLLREGGYEYFIATGDNFQRAEIYKYIWTNTTMEPLNCIHPSSVISPSAKIGYGNLVCPTAVIHTDAEIENCTIINTGAIIEHDCRVKNFAQVSPNATLCGRVNIGEYSFIGAGSTIIPNKHVSNKSVVAAGSVVIDYVSQNMMVAGVPAKIKKKDYHEI